MNRNKRTTHEYTLPPYNVDEQRQSVRVISTTLNQGLGGRGANKDVDAVETKKSEKIIDKEASVDNSIGQD